MDNDKTGILPFMYYVQSEAEAQDNFSSAHRFTGYWIVSICRYDYTLAPVAWMCDPRLVETPVRRFAMKIRKIEANGEMVYVELTDNSIVYWQNLTVAQAKGIVNSFTQAIKVAEGNRKPMEYDYAAEWCAKRGIKGKLGDPLPEGLSKAVLNEIANDPEAFEDRIKGYAYAITMDGVFPEE